MKSIRMMRFWISFEEELTVDDLDKVFGALIPRIQKILKKLVDSGSPYCKQSKLGKSKYDIQKVDELNHDILTLLQYDMERFRMDVSTHPFTEAMGINDIRITTRYEGTDFKKSISSTIHEAGHALYNLQCDPSLSVTPLEGGSSLALHESQSRFWENIVSRSLPFVQLIAPLIRKQVSQTKQQMMSCTCISITSRLIIYELTPKKYLEMSSASLRFLNSGTIEWSNCLE